MVPLRTEIIIRATRTQNVLGEKGQRIRELTTVIQKRCVGMVFFGWVACVCEGLAGGCYAGINLDTELASLD